VLRSIAAVVLTVIGLFMVVRFKTTPVERTVATPVPTAAVAAGPPTPTPTLTRTVDGPVVDMRWGPVQVAVTLQGATITDVSALELPTDHARSAYISQTVAPILRNEALQAQSSNISVISGATFTTDAYARSLQGALDSAHA